MSLLVTNHHEVHVATWCDLYVCATHEADTCMDIRFQHVFWQMFWDVCIGPFWMVWGFALDALGNERPGVASDILILTM